MKVEQAHMMPEMVQGLTVEDKQVRGVRSADTPPC